MVATGVVSCRAQAQCASVGTRREQPVASGQRQPLVSTRRAALGSLALLPASCVAAAWAETTQLSEYEPMDALKGKDYGKSRMRYSDFVTTETGLQYKDLREGQGEAPQRGDTVVIDWAGYTIGYYGRPFEARNKPKGSSFTGDNKDYYRFRLGEGQVVPGVEEAVASMRPGSIRRVIVPVELGYPDNDWRKSGPAPSTFAGQRALDFVLANKGMIDKTLLFDIELVRVQQP